MGSVRGITIELGFDNKSKLKLRAIAKHVSALADELDAIDNAWTCSECGHGTKVTRYHDDTRDYTQCEACGALVDDELPTHPEGSD
ncbi:hypothetical protein [Lysinibacillus capsici]|uniref:hypothetical protein n=1 Tax=Lysinibacillus capsici TaxID=2115968 RepID=UPI003BAC7CDD